MSDDNTIYTFLGLRVKTSDFKREERSAYQDFCRCSENDKSKPYCAYCGNSNKEKYKTTIISLVEENFDSSSDFDNYITVKGRKWRVYIPYKNAKYPPMEFSYILCYDEYLEKDSYDYTSVMLSLNIENIASDINIFREYMKHIDLWDGENFGIHSVAEDDY